MKVSSLLRNELNSLQAASDGSAVRDLANRIMERQEQQDTERKAESRRIIELHMQQSAERKAEAGETTTSCPFESTDELPVAERAKRDADIGEHAACSC
jgi:hypothetical protein